MFPKVQHTDATASVFLYAAASGGGVSRLYALWLCCDLK